MIWTVDPLTFCLAALILVASLLGIGNRGRAVRGVMIATALLVYMTVRLSFAEAVGGAFSISVLSGIAGSFAIVLALVSSGLSGAYIASLLTLSALAVAFTGFTTWPVGWIGLLHQIAVLDLVAVCIATTYLGLSDKVVDHQAGLASGAGVSAATDQAAVNWVKLPERLSGRAATMFLIVCGSLAWAMYRERTIFGASGLVELWAVGSEVLAALVAWRVIHRWVRPGSNKDQQGWRLKLGLFVAGTAASLGLLLIPVIIAAAEMLPEIAD